MNRERMKKLAAGLRKIKAGFDLRDFVCSTTNMSKEDFIAAMQDHTEGSACGAVGCAIGHFPIIFPEDWVYNGQPENTVTHKMEYDAYVAYLPKNKLQKKYSTEWRRQLWQAALDYLDIDDKTGSFLFEYESYYGSTATAEAVAGRIESLLGDSVSNKQPNLFAVVAN